MTQLREKIAGLLRNAYVEEPLVQEVATSILDIPEIKEALAFYSGQSDEEQARFRAFMQKALPAP